MLAETSERRLEPSRGISAMGFRCCLMAFLLLEWRKLELRQVIVSRKSLCVSHKDVKSDTDVARDGYLRG